MDWTLLQAGCLDELSLIVSPCAGGETDAAAIFDRSAFIDGSPVGFRLEKAEVLENDVLWLVYRANNKE